MKRIFRTKDGETRTAWRSRAALAGVVAICMAATTLAVTGAGADTAGMKFVQSGHLIYNSTLGTVFHIDGGTKNVDGQVEVGERGPGVRTVQTDTKGFMLARGSITEFGKSDLQVAEPRPAPSDEQPTALEAPGTAFAVYRGAGAISRLGNDPVTISGLGGLGQPVSTSNGTLWVHRLNNRELCQLPANADRLSCPAELTSGHTGALTVVNDQVVFVDTTARELRVVGSDGFGRTVPIPSVQLTPESLIAPYDVNGRIAIVNPAKNEIHLVDPAISGDRKPAEPVVQKLPSGKYSQVASSGKGVALIDESSNSLVTLDADGKQKTAARPIRTGADKGGPGKGQRPELFRGADKQLYVDSASGEHSMVVDEDGEVTEVEARDPGENGDGKRKPSTKPSTPPASTPPSTKPTRNEPPRTGKPEQTEGPGEGENKPNRPRRTEPPKTNKPKPRETVEPSSPPPTRKPSPKPKPQPVKASPAAAPPGLSAAVTDGAVTLTWRQPNLNGGKLTGYRVTLAGAAESTATRRYTRSGLTNGTAYTFQVRAITRGTDGKALTGVAASITATPRGDGTFTITQDTKPVSAYGDEYDDKNCAEDEANNCYYFLLKARGLEPNTEYVFHAYSNGREIHEDKNYTLTTDENGNLNQKKFHNARVGETVYVTATGPGGPYKSNSFVWHGGG